MNVHRLFVLAVAVAASSSSLRAVPTVTESERRIPVVNDVDVVVVGGSSAGVGAAVAAARAGASVFLLSDRPYLGDDLCGTLRLWPEENDPPGTELARAVFAPGPALGGDSGDALPCTYTANRPPSPKHPDAKPPRLLTDGHWSSANTESVQYDGDVAITADLGSPVAVREARIFLFQRDGADFTAARVQVETSTDGAVWALASDVPNVPPEDECCVVALPLTGTVQKVRFTVTRAPESTRILVGEIQILSAARSPAAAAKPAFGPVTPMHVKRTLDEALLKAGVGFLYNSFATELLRDADGQPAGIVMANRSGRQAVRARVIVDATPRAAVARMAGAAFAAYPAGEQTFLRHAIGGEVCQGDGLQGRVLPWSFPTVKKDGRSASIIAYTLRLPMKDAGPSSWAGADQQSRDLLWHPLRLDLAENLFQVPPDPVKAVKADERAWPGAAHVELDAFRPAGVARLYVLGGCAALTREAAAALLRPCSYLAAGDRIGAAAAADARKVRGGGEVRVADLPEKPEAVAVPGDVLEFLAGVRPTQQGLPTVVSPKRALPVLGRFDVVIIGGGTAGAPAGIGASRAGGRTLLVEFLHGLGGVGTQGRIIKYYHGYRGGFTAQVDEGIKALDCPNPVVGKSEWWRRANREAGTEIWFGCIGAGAYVEKTASGTNVVRGAVVVTPYGRGVVLANTVIDATGNSDIAAAAGAASDYTGAQEASVQGTGLPPLGLNDDYTNTDWTFADDTDVVDITHHYVVAKQKYKKAFDLGQLVDTRERRRIVGDVILSPMDIVNGRTWRDTINIARSNFDTHGYTVHPFFMAMPPDKQDMDANVPLRALLPRGLDGVLVTGLGVSAHRDAMPIIRMQPDVQNQGYACGRAAAVAARDGVTIRGLDLRKVQPHLVEIGLLPQAALTAVDAGPFDGIRLQGAAEVVLMTPPDEKEKPDGAVRDRGALAMLFSDPARALPLLREEHAKAEGDERTGYAFLLALLRDPAGFDDLLACVRRTTDFDKGWNYKGMGQFGRSVSELDAQIIALGQLRDPRALDAILPLVAKLDASREFSHHRACAMALESIRDPRAAKPLAELLAKPGIRGHAVRTIEASVAKATTAATDNSVRNESLRELTLARALYRCGDEGGVGAEVLRAYAQDLRGHYARHARAVLDEVPGPAR